METMELIYAHLIATPTEWLQVQHPNTLAASATACLRLVCPAWAEWLYPHHLYRGLKFSSASRSMEFAKHMWARSETLPRPQCQHLVIDRIWAREPPPKNGAQDMIDWELVEILLDLFAHSVVTLHLQFVDFPWLPIEDIKAIGRLENLRDLHLNNSSTHSGDEQFPGTDPDFFNDLIVAAKGLKSLVLDITISLPYEGLWEDKPYPAITHLDVTQVLHRPTDILRLSTAFKPSLKALSVRDNGPGINQDEIFAGMAEFGVNIFEQMMDHFGIELPGLRRVYENLQDTLEALSLSSSHLLKDSLDFRFPKLRVLAIDYWINSITEFLAYQVFTQSPIEILAIDAQAAYDECEPKFVGNPFANLPYLKKLVFMSAKSDYSAPPKLLEACEAISVKCVYIDHHQLPLIMVS
jgi:hypothetical protein